MPEPEMKSHSGVFTHILTLVVSILTVALVATIGSYIFVTHPPLTLSEASAVVANILDSYGPTTLQFRTGPVRRDVSDDPGDVRYRLLEKAGIVSITKVSPVQSSVRLTRMGESMMSKIAGTNRSAAPDGVLTYSVPLAQMRLAVISSILRTGYGRATVQFTWQWKPTELGSVFDPSGEYAQALSGDEWTELIDKYGARRYRQLPTKAAVGLQRESDGWRLAAD